MTRRSAFIGARIFDGTDTLDRMALIVADGKVEGLAAADSPIDAERIPVGPGLIVPGFVDLQVNGGGGVLFNHSPTVAGIRTICETHARFGTTALLPTLITDTDAVLVSALAAGAEAATAGVPGFLGLHLEGPHLAVSRKGAHDPALIRPITEADIARLADARRTLPNLLVTIAPEAVDPTQVSALVAAGVEVSLGHTDATYAMMQAASEAGARLVTHLFNAQSQLQGREPGAVGAALSLGNLWAGLIADGIHVHPKSVHLAFIAKAKPGQIFLVTDAMSLTGSDADTFELNGRTVHRRDGALRLADGTLAGADLTMIGAVRYMVETIGLPLDEALRMASLYPARALGIDKTHGHLRRSARADFTVLSRTLDIRSTWIDGEKVFGS